MSVTVQKNRSRLRHATLVQYGDLEFWDRPRIPDIETSSGDIIHVVSMGERIDSIANRYYGDQGLWWVIAHANNLNLLPCDLIVGDRIVIPDPRSLRRGILI